METEPKKDNFKDRVLGAIEAEHVRPYSKARFALQLTLLAIVVGLFLLVSVFIFGYLFFFLRVSGRVSLLASGGAGFLFFLRTFPWIWLGIDLVLLFALEQLLHKFRFWYRRPVLYILLALLAASLSLGFIVDRGGLNDGLLHEADAHHLPYPIGELFEGARRPPQGDGFCRCAVVAVGTSSFFGYDVIMVAPTATIEIILPPGFPTSSLAPGDIVFVAGKRSDSSTIRAFDVTAMAPDQDDQ